MQGNKQDGWVMKQTVLRARDERGLERSLHSFENALRLREGSIVDGERTEIERRSRHVAIIRYELPLPAVQSHKALDASR
jgi:hypothetical protein